MAEHSISPLLALRADVSLQRRVGISSNRWLSRAVADAIDWDWIDEELADGFSDSGRPGLESRFMVGLLLLKHIYGLSDEGCERWVL